MEAPLQPVTITELAFPDYNASPTHPPELPARSQIALTVACQFGRPEVRSRCGNGRSTALWMAVPETAMNKDHSSSTRKYKVGRTRKTSIVQDVAISQAVNQATHGQLGLRILPPDARHEVASGGGSEVVLALRDEAHGSNSKRPA